jgi:RNA polymerase sigma factor (sigma-70 family)
MSRNGELTVPGSGSAVMMCSMRRAAMEDPEQAEVRIEPAAPPQLDTPPPALIRPSPTTRRTPATEAFSAFYREHFAALVTFLMYQGARLADAQELAQETMTVAFRSWETIEHPKAWTRRVASRALIRRIASIDDPVNELPESEALSSERDITDWEDRHEILRLLRLLPPRQRQVLAWTFDGFSPAQIAAELGLKPEVVRSNLKKARRAASAHIAAQGENER